MEHGDAQLVWMVPGGIGGDMHEASQQTLDGIWLMARRHMAWHSCRYDPRVLQEKFLAIPSFLQDVNLVMDFHMSFKKGEHSLFFH